MRQSFFGGPDSYGPPGQHLVNMGKSTLKDWQVACPLVMAGVSPSVFSGCFKWLWQSLLMD